MGLNPYLESMLVEVCYSLVDATSYKYSRRVIVKALRNGIDCYKNKITWTGTGSITPNGHNPRFTIGDDPFSNYKFCKVDFERPLKKKEKLEIRYSLDLKDPGMQARPFLNHTIHNPIHKLIMRVHFLHDDGGVHFKKEIFMSPMSEMPLWEEKVLLPLDSKEAVWEIDRPRQGYCYRLTWKKE